MVSRFPSVSGICPTAGKFSRNRENDARLKREMLHWSIPGGYASLNHRHLVNDALSACFETLALNISELPEDLSTSQANFHNSRVPGGVLKLYRSKLF